MSSFTNGFWLQGTDCCSSFPLILYVEKSDSASTSSLSDHTNSRNFKQAEFNCPSDHSSHVILKSFLRDSPELPFCYQNDWRSVKLSRDIERAPFCYVPKWKTFKTDQFRHAENMHRFHKSDHTCLLSICLKLKWEAFQIFLTFEIFPVLFLFGIKIFLYFFLYFTGVSSSIVPRERVPHFVIKGCQIRYSRKNLDNNKAFTSAKLVHAYYFTIIFPSISMNLAPLVPKRSSFSNICYFCKNIFALANKVNLFL